MAGPKRIGRTQQVSQLEKTEHFLKYKNTQLTRDLEFMRNSNKRLARLVSLLTTPQPVPSEDCANWVLA